MTRSARSALLFAALVLFFVPLGAEASHISGIRITQTGNTGLMINVDITAFYTTGSTTSEAYLGTYYNAVPAIAWGDGATTPRYGYGPSTGIPLVSTSTVVNGIPARAYRGSFSHTYGAGGNYTISANTRCCPLTTPTYTLVTGTIVTTTVSTTGIFGPTVFTTSFVQNTLAVAANPPAFTKAFAPTSVGIGTSSTLTFTIDNSNNTLDDNALDFTDNLPAGLVVANPANTVNTCTGGTVTATSGTAVVSYTGGEVAAGATCTLSVDVTSDLPGDYVNTSGNLTSTFGDSGTATADLTVTAVPLGFTKAFAPDTVNTDTPSTLTFTIDNAANAAAVSAVDFTDTLPAGVVVSDPANVVNSCTGGTVTAAPGSGTVSYTGGTVNAAGGCTISVDVEAPTVGVYVNTTGDLTSTAGNSGTATATLDVANPPVFTKEFNPLQISPGDVTTLTFTIDNSANATDATGLAFVDNLPAGMEVADPANVVDGCGGAVVAVPGTGLIDYTGGTVTAGSLCTVSVDVTITTAGTFENIADPLNSNLGSTAAGTTTAALFGGTVLDVPTLSWAGSIALVSILGLMAIVAIRRRN